LAISRPSSHPKKPGRAQFLLLAALTVTLGPRELDRVLAEGRALADSLITGP
jgi:hypothetical protein